MGSAAGNILQWSGGQMGSATGNILQWSGGQMGSATGNMHYYDLSGGQMGSGNTIPRPMFPIRLRMDPDFFRRSGFFRWDPNVGPIQTRTQEKKSDPDPDNRTRIQNTDPYS